MRRLTLAVLLATALATSPCSASGNRRRCAPQHREQLTEDATTMDTLALIATMNLDIARLQADDAKRRGEISPPTKRDLSTARVGRELAGIDIDRAVAHARDSEPDECPVCGELGYRDQPENCSYCEDQRSTRPASAGSR